MLHDPIDPGVSGLGRPILLLDDQPARAQALAEALRQAGYPVLLTQPGGAPLAALLEALAGLLALGPASVVAAAPLLVSGELVIDLLARGVWRAGQRVALKPRAFDLLAFLARHPGRVFPRAALLAQVWGPAAHACPRTVDVHVRWLRAKLEPDPDHPQIIQTAHGVGYKFALPVVVR